VWLIGAMVCLYAALRVQLFVSAGNRWPRDAPLLLMPISCHFQDCKSASDHEYDFCKQRYSKYPGTFTFKYKIITNIICYNIGYLSELLQSERSIA